jgi:CBS domain-containing protein
LLAGIVTRADLVRAFSRSDHDVDPGEQDMLAPDTPATMREATPTGARDRIVSRA